MPRSREADKIVLLGETLFGADWQSQFARMTGIARSLISMIAAGDRAVTDGVRQKVSAGLRAEIKRLRTRAVTVTELLKEYER
jgi:transcriptional regulator with XRE-family HTH domain